MEQLTLPFPPDHPSTHRILFCKNDVPLFTLSADSIAEAQFKRRELVRVLQQNYLDRTVWEENPRPTGWWGLRPTRTGEATVYNIIIETIRTELEP